MLYHLDSLIAFVGVILLGSLMVTALTQVVIALLNLRGKNLLWGLKRLVSEIEPSLQASSEAIVRKILANPLVSVEEKGKGFWGRFHKLPAVIRREEFSRLLIKLAESKDADEFGDVAAKGLRDLTTVDPDELKKKLDALPQDLGKAAENELKKINELIFNKFKTARSKIVELEGWFDNLMDRLGQRFARASRVIAVCGALFIAVFFKLDSIQLIKQTYADQELRTRLLASVTGIQEMGNALLGGPNYYDVAFGSLKEKHPDFTKPSDSFILTREGADRWLQENGLEGVPFKELSKEYDDALTEAIKEKLGSLGNNLMTMNATLNDMSLRIFGEKYLWQEPLDLSRILGILISIVLLSLGAPFWFNVLKNLTNFRTSLMKKEEKERLERQGAK